MLQRDVMHNRGLSSNSTYSICCGFVVQLVVQLVVMLWICCGFVVQLVIRLVIMLWTCCGFAVGGIMTHFFTKWRILTMTCYSLVAL